MKKEFIDELLKCIGKEVCVYDIGNIEHKGICKAIDPVHLNVVLMTDTHKVIVKNIRYISRLRSNGNNVSV